MNEKEFIKNKHDELVNTRGMLLLKPMNDTRIKSLLEEINKYDDMIAFVIKQYDYKKNQIVLRYRVIDLDTNINDLVVEMNNCYQKAFYQTVIEIGKSILERAKNVKSVIYSKIGFSYLHLKDKEKAIAYFEVANYLAYKEAKMYNYDDILADLKGQDYNEEKKPYFKMEEEDFSYDDVIDNYGFFNFTLFNDYVMYTNSDVNTALKNLSVSEENANIIKLIYAKLYYANQDFSKGDIFLNDVLEQENKTKEVLEIANEIRNNKFFYQNRSQKLRPLSKSIKLN